MCAHAPFMDDERDTLASACDLQGSRNGRGRIIGTVRPSWVRSSRIMGVR
jgi:hypothetical protein